MAACVAVLASLGVGQPAGPFAQQRTSLPESVFEMANTLQRIVVELDSLRAELSALKAASPDSPQAEAALASVEVSVERIGERINSIESAILQDPEKAVAVPILRRDLDNLEQSLRRDVSATRDEIARIHDQNRWFFGLMGTAWFGLLSLAVANLFKSRNDRSPVVNGSAGVLASQSDSSREWGNTELRHSIRCRRRKPTTSRKG